jgi:hypothetical protein
MSVVTGRKGPRVEFVASCANGKAEPIRSLTPAEQSDSISPIAVIDASLLHKCTLCTMTGADQGPFIEAKPKAALQEQQELLLA